MRRAELDRKARALAVAAPGAPAAALIALRAGPIYNHPMPGLILIDGNNLLHAMHAHAPVPHVGRETLVKIVERWARGGDEAVIVVFDGPVPYGALAKQMTSKRTEVRFAAPATADDVIVALIQGERDPARVLVVSDDTAIRYEARRRRCRHSGAVAFVAELFPPGAKPESERRPARGNKPTIISDEEKREWLDAFDDGKDDDPFDAMLQ